MSVKARLFALSLVVVSAAGVSTPATAEAPTARTPQKPSLKVIDFQTAFSPNGDHRKDIARVRYRLGGPARISVEIRKGSRTIRRTNLGRRAAGRHVVTWDGRNRGGKTMRDGDDYSIRISARSNGKVRMRKSDVRLDTDGSGDLITSRRTVYPRAKVVRDKVWFTFLYSGWNSSDDAMESDRYQQRSRLRIVNRHGDVVWKRTSRDDSKPSFIWNARTKGGTPVPTGTYRAKFSTEDEAGNPFHSTRRITVSPKQLVARTSSETVTADVPSDYLPSWGGCMDCNSFAPPVPSERFPGGLSFRPVGAIAGTARYMSMPSPVVPAPVDTYRVSAIGGPTTLGSADVGEFWAGDDYVKTAVGDGMTRTKWVRVTLQWEPYLPGGTNPVDFGFRTRGDASYDVASFTIDYRYYVPAGG